MSFEIYYLDSLRDENDPNNSPFKVCSMIRSSLVTLHNESCDKLSNASSCLLLDKKLNEYSTAMNDKETLDSLSGPIDSLLKGKIQTRHCSQWKFSLKSSPEVAVKMLKNNIFIGEHCLLNKNLPCIAGDITKANIADLLQRKEMKSETVKSFEIQQPSMSRDLELEKSKANKAAVNNRPISANPNGISGNNNSFVYPIKNNNSNNMSTAQINKSGISSSARSPSAFIEPKRIKFTEPAAVVNAPTKSFSDENNHHSHNRDRGGYVAPDRPVGGLFFRTASEEHRIQNKKKYGNSKGNYQHAPEVAVQKRSLGTTRSVQSKFVPPLACGNNMDAVEEKMETETEQDERLKHIDPKMVELIMNEIIDSSAPISWDDISGLEFAKTAIQEAVVWPLLRPDIFTGLRRPPKGILLFGPPGTGKTLIGKCIASQCCATFFSISASSLTSKWIGDGEKMVRALFAVARCHQPAVVFIDEIDSLLTQRSDAEHEASRRIKTEFLVQLDGAATGDDDRLLVIGATNRPQELDEAARRRLVKRLYIPLPDIMARKQIISRLMSSERNSLTEEDIDNIATLADGFSGADMRSLCSEAALGPIRAVPFTQITNIQSDQVRPVSCDDFKKALTRVRPSVSGNDLEHYIKWDKTYGSGSNTMSH